MTLKITNDRLSFSTFGIEGDLKISLQRTIRLPDNGTSHQLPPGIGNFEILKVSDYAHKLAPHIVEKGGVFCCMYPYEALWIHFQGRSWRPNAVMVASGMINALTGERWSEDLHAHPQNYCVTGGGISKSQPWLDGWMTDPIRKDVRQFVAAELGRGETVEEQLTGKAEFGGLQIKVFEASNSKFTSDPPAYKRSSYLESPTSQAKGMGMSSKLLCATNISEDHYRGGGIHSLNSMSLSRSAPSSMGLAAGAKIDQEIHLDSLALHDWDQNGEKVFIHLFNPAAWEQITGRKAPVSPVTLEHLYNYGWKKDYIYLHYPSWFVFPTVIQTARPTTSSHNPLSPLAYISPIDPNAVKPGMW